MPGIGREDLPTGASSLQNYLPLFGASLSVTGFGFFRVLLQKISGDACPGFPLWKLGPEPQGRCLSVTPETASGRDQEVCVCFCSRFGEFPTLGTVPVTQFSQLQIAVIFIIGLGDSWLRNVPSIIILFRLMN